MKITDELRSFRQLAELLGIATGYHLVKLAGNLVDPLEGVIEHRVSQLLARHVLRHFQLEVEVSGTERVRDLQRYAVVSSHGSHLDWAVLLAHFPSPLRFIAKKELASMPVVGSYLRSRGVLIDRRRGIDARRAIQAAISDGQTWPILIFPEGTRSPDGSLGPFRRGGLRILAQAGLTLVPVAIVGTFAALPRGSRIVQPRRRLQMSIGEPVRPGELASVSEAIAELERRLRADHAALQAAQRS